ncbi:MAG: hypothetical protein KKE73_07695 [Proteobacteria bacterium]|nr:hypothetical protein [Pseudomonadota bacterium]
MHSNWDGQGRQWRCGLDGFYCVGVQEQGRGDEQCPETVGTVHPCPDCLELPGDMSAFLNRRSEPSGPVLTCAECGYKACPRQCALDLLEALTAN